MKDDRILLVDDEREVGAAVMRDLRVWCREEGIIAVPVTSAQEALDELDRAQGGYSVVVSDLQMPGLKGNALIRIISERWPDIVTIVLTGNMELDFVQDFLDSGVFSFVRKPWNRETLIRDLSRALMLNHFRRGEREVHGAAAKELSLAHEFQAKLLKLTLPDDPRLTIDIYRESGGSLDFTGDFLDLKRLDENRILIVLADVSGQGLQASFITSLLKSIMDADLALVFENRPLSPGTFAEWINRRMCGHLRAVDSFFVALLVIELDLGQGLCRWVNAGQPPFVSLSESGSFVTKDVSLPTAIDEETVYTEQSFAFPAGAQIIISTDGLYPSGQREDGYGASEYFEIILACMARGLGAAETAGKLRERSGLTKPVDDLTMVRLVRTGAVHA